MILIWRVDTNPDIWTEAEAMNYLDLYDLGLNITGCVPIPRQLPNLIIDIKTVHKPADFFFAGLVFVVSKNLRKLFERFNVNVEFSGITALRLGNLYSTEEYFVVNILDAVECFDYEKSRYKQTPNGVDKIKKLVLDDSKAVGHHLFRVGPCLSINPNPKAIQDVIQCSSEELAAQVFEIGISGVVFTKPEDWRSYPPPSWRPT